jgi:hypothetical protein
MVAFSTIFAYVVLRIFPLVLIKPIGPVLVLKIQPFF